MFVGCGQSYTDLKKLNVKSIVKTLLKWMLHLVLQYVLPTKSLLSSNPPWHRHFHVGSEIFVPCNCVWLTSFMVILLCWSVYSVASENTIYMTLYLVAFKAYTVNLEIYWSHRAFDTQKWWNKIPLRRLCAFCVWANWQLGFKWLFVYTDISVLSVYGRTGNLFSNGCLCTLPSPWTRHFLKNGKTGIALHTVAPIPFQILGQRCAF
jgi:hypothetical protein